MSDGWLVSYKNGETVIMSDKAHTKSQEALKETVESEVHYLDMRELVSDNPWLEVVMD